MNLTLYHMIYLLCNLISTYLLLKYFHIFFQEQRSSKKAELFSFFLFFALLSTAYIFVNQPFLTLFINIIGIYLLTYNYLGTQKNRIFLTLFYCLITMLIESMIVSITLKTPMPLNAENYSLIYGPIFTTIFLYILILLLERWKHVEKQLKLPLLFWLMVLLIPLSSFIAMLLIIFHGKLGIAETTTCCLLFLIINFSALSLYEMLNSHISDKMEKQFLEQQNIFYTHQLEQMKISLNATNKLKHDLKNDFIAMQSLSQNHDYERLDRYINDFFHGKILSSTTISCGNISMDSILNFKLSEAKDKGICLKTKISIPHDIDFSSRDIVIILGNLLDNAIEATEKVKEHKEIYLNIFYERNYLYIIEKNSYVGTIKKLGEKFLSTKADRENHGYGIENIKEAVKHNLGSMEIQYENQIFIANIVILINKKI